MLNNKFTLRIFKGYHIVRLYRENHVFLSLTVSQMRHSRLKTMVSLPWKKLCIVGFIAHSVLLTYNSFFYPSIRKIDIRFNFKQYQLKSLNYNCDKVSPEGFRLLVLSVSLTFWKRITCNCIVWFSILFAGDMRWVCWMRCLISQSFSSFASPNPPRVRGRAMKNTWGSDTKMKQTSIVERFFGIKICLLAGGIGVCPARMSTYQACQVIYI